MSTLMTVDIASGQTKSARLLTFAAHLIKELAELAEDRKTSHSSATIYICKFAEIKPPCGVIRRKPSNENRCLPLVP